MKPIEKSRTQVDLDGYLERHYDRLFARWEIKDPLAMRIGAFCGPVPAEGIYQSSFGRDMLLPGVRLLIEARQGIRSLAFRLLLLTERAKQSSASASRPQLELFT